MCPARPALDRKKRPHEGQGTVGANDISCHRFIFKTFVNVKILQMNIVV